MQTTVEIARDWEIVLSNPDPPGGMYRYPYYLRAGGQGWDDLQGRLAALGADRFVLVTDSGFPRSLAETMRQRLAAVAPCTLHCFPGTERAKNLETVTRLAAEAKQAGATRHSVIVGLGGGLAGNVAGLLSALLYRGVPLVLINGTLLAMSDSSLSLKQGVNTAEGKNLLGAYKAPALVWSDVTLLDSLPPREIRAAWCEEIKNVWAIRPADYDEVVGLLRPDARYTHAQQARMIELALAAKSSVLRRDAHEKHDAFLLEAGHTVVGHALEFFTGGAIPHGLAIGIGLVVEAKIAHLLGLVDEAACAANLTWLSRLLQQNGAPTAIPADITAEDLLPIIAHDNKRGTLGEPPDTVPVVVLTGPGTPHRTSGTVLTPVPLSIVREAIDWSRAQPDPFALAAPGVSAAATH